MSNLDLRQLAAQWESSGLNRRDFLRLSVRGVSAASIAGILAACGGCTSGYGRPERGTIGRPEHRRFCRAVSGREHRRECRPKCRRDDRADRDRRLRWRDRHTRRNRWGYAIGRR